MQLISLNLGFLIDMRIFNWYANFYAGRMLNFSPKIKLVCL